VVTAVPPRYAAEVAPVRERFAALVIVDGSRLAAIAHRLKLLWNERAVILPGCLLGVYDVGRGVCRHLHFSADAAASEMTRAKAALADLARDTLVLGDRPYSTADFFAALGRHHCWGVVRRNRQLSLRKLQRLRKRRIHGGLLEDWLVHAGTGVSAPRQLLRFVRWRRGGTRYELLTNVLAPARLSAEEALDLYPHRWGVERMFFDLKEVLNLNRLYAANPNAVAMQVYAAAIVYNALRVAQSDGAAQVGLAPEALSPAKFYPKVVTATFLYLHRQQWEREIRLRYRRLHLCLVGGRRRWIRASPAPVQVEHRADHRRARRFCPARRHWKSFAHVPGGRRFMKLS
jgi:hypothetical protein